MCRFRSRFVLLWFNLLFSILFFAAILQAYNFDAQSYVIVIHNNGGSNFSANSYAAGGEYAGDASQVYVSDQATVRNFFLVTQMPTFKALVDQSQNVVLQSGNATNDGSLSYYCANVKLKNYVNIEGAAADDSEGGCVALQVDQYVAMSKALLSQTDVCGGWMTGIALLSVAAVALIVIACLLTCVIMRRRQQGYSAIEGMYNKY